MEDFINRLRGTIPQGIANTALTQAWPGAGLANNIYKGYQIAKNDDVLGSIANGQIGNAMNVGINSLWPAAGAANEVYEVVSNPGSVVEPVSKLINGEITNMWPGAGAYNAIKQGGEDISNFGKWIDSITKEAIDRRAAAKGGLSSSNGESFSFSKDGYDVTTDADGTVTIKKNEKSEDELKDGQGGNTTPVEQKDTDTSSSPEYDIDEMAGEFILGAWGNGQDRIDNMINAGYSLDDYNAIQQRVNDAYASGRDLHEWTNKANAKLHYW